MRRATCAATIEDVSESLLSRIRRRDPELASTLATDLAEVERSLWHAIENIPDARTVRAATPLLAAGGMRLRPLLTLLSAQFGAQCHGERVSAAALVELVHMATLCHDDVMDGARMRRGIASVNALWGSKVAVLVGDRLLVAAGLMGVELGQEVVRGHAGTLRRLVRGQTAEMGDAPTGRSPVEHYRQVAADKTAALLEFAAWLGGSVARADSRVVDRLVRYANALGIAFQIRDDLRDLRPSEVSGKPMGTDLREGVRTLPLLYALSDGGPTGRRLRDLVADGPVTDEARLREAVTLLIQSPALPQVRVELHRQVTFARDQLDQLPAGPGRHALDVLCDHVVDDDC